MIINAPEVKILLDQYDFFFHSGIMIPFTLNKEAGDTITFKPDVIEITQAPKPNPTDYNQIIKGEEITIFKTHLLTIHHRVVERLALTPEQQFEWQKTVKELGSPH
jgi:hypothetical protein